MQLPTHILAGVLIQIAFLRNSPVSENILLILIFLISLISHFFIDALAKITYPPPVRQPGLFWLVWHIFVHMFGFILLIIYLKDYWIGILGANLVDI
jgi:hypothetical protein